MTDLDTGKHRKSGKGGLGCLFVISAPSGCGKSTLCRALRHRFKDLRYSVSSTTRNLRTGERDGVDYHFIGKGEFKTGIRKRLWAEWAEVHGHYYGTAAATIDETLSAGHDLLLDIDVQGTRQIVERYPDAITIFIVPPSMEELRRRLESRNTDSPEQIERRLRTAEKEMTARDSYRYVVINDHLSEAVEDLTGIIASCRPGSGAG